MPPYSLRSEAVPTAGCNPDKYRSIGVTPEMGPQYQDHRPAARSGDETCTGGTRKTQPWNNFLAPALDTNPEHPAHNATLALIVIRCYLTRFNLILKEPFLLN